MKIPRAHYAILCATLAVLILSGIHPFDRLTWWLEIAPGLAAIILLVAIYRRFRFTTFVYALIGIHISILCIGGHYTYAKVPLFNWVRDTLHWARNDYDRLGHFAQGFVPAMIAREVFLRLGVLNRRGWMPFLIISVCLAISAFYELVEWWTALAGGAASDAFLGTQGDVWDTQEDMLMALIGALCALVFCSRLQDREIARLTTPPP